MVDVKQALVQAFVVRFAFFMQSLQEEGGIVDANAKALTSTIDLISAMNDSGLGLIVDMESINLSLAKLMLEYNNNG